jgi:hypothetical protein
MAIVKLWRFAFMTRTVMGFLASSFSLVAAHAPVDDAHRQRQARRDRQHGHRGARLPLRGPARQVHQRRWEAVRLQSQALAPGASTDTGELHIPGPPGWRSRHSSSSGITEYFTHNLRAGVASFVVPPTVEFAGTKEEFQAGLLQNVSEGMPVVEGSTRAGTVGGFHFVSCTMKPPWGAARRIVLYTALWEGKGQVLLFGADCDALFHDHVLGVHALVQKIVVPNR